MPRSCLSQPHPQTGSYPSCLFLLLFITGPNSQTTRHWRSTSHGSLVTTEFCHHCPRQILDVPTHHREHRHLGPVNPESCLFFVRRRPSRRGNPSSVRMRTVTDAWGVPAPILSGIRARIEPLLKFRRKKNCFFPRAEPQLQGNPRFFFPPMDNSTSLRIPLLLKITRFTTRRGTWRILQDYQF